ncbi:MAG: stage II sporulation protein D [Ruminococcus sp.]|nr:stage II sporulation protein D [Ruminococcus sp.]
MKKQIEIMLIFSIFLLFIPCLSFLKHGNNTNSGEYDSATVKILFTEQNRVEEIPLEDYLVGAVLAQMPAEFDIEALKAQTVLAHTYILSRQLSEEASPTKALNGAAISDDSSLYQSYFTSKQAEKLYGDGYSKALSKVKKAVDSVKNKVLTYENEPIVVSFHAISSGKTESAKDMWGTEIPYLKSVDSKWDSKTANFEKSTVITLKELSEHFPQAGDIDENSLEIVKKTTNGTILSIKINDLTMTGTEFANALSLPSPCFTLNFEDDSCIIKSKGLGHLVGMSQYGADYLSKQGKSYQEILEHYFPKTQLSNE